MECASSSSFLPYLCNSLPSIAVFSVKYVNTRQLFFLVLCDVPNMFLHAYAYVLSCVQTGTRAGGFSTFNTLFPSDSVSISIERKLGNFVVRLVRRVRLLHQMQHFDRFDNILEFASSSLAIAVLSNVDIYGAFAGFNNARTFFCANSCLAIAAMV